MTQNKRPKSPEEERRGSIDAKKSREDMRLILGDLQSIASEMNEQEAMNGVKLGKILSHSKGSSLGNSLDFERIVNSYSIQATRERLKNRIGLCETAKNNPIESHENLNFSGKTMHRRMAALVDENFSIMEMEETGSDDENQEIKSVGAFELNNLSSSNGIRSFQVNDPFIRPSESSYYGFQRDADTGKYEKTGRSSMFGYSGRTAMRWVLTCATGLLTGMVTIFILSSVEKLVVLRSNSLIRAAAEWHYPGVGAEWISFLALAGYNGILAISSAAMCLLLAPSAVGSGIPDVKAYLNGVRVSKFADPKLFFVKVFGTSLSVSSGLAVGPEGPLVHVGAIIGALITKTRSVEMAIMNLKSRLSRIFRYVTHLGLVADSEGDASHTRLSSPMDTSKSQPQNCWSALVHQLSQFRTDKERRDFVSTGAACGSAAAFGAPVGGVLFSMEEASSFLLTKSCLRRSQQLSSRPFVLLFTMVIFSNTALFNSASQKHPMNS